MAIRQFLPQNWMCRASAGTPSPRLSHGEAFYFPAHHLPRKRPTIAPGILNESDSLAFLRAVDLEPI
jgi:hypothetical protein